MDLFKTLLLVSCFVFLTVGVPNTEEKKYDGYDVVLKIINLGTKFAVDVYSSSNYKFSKVMQECYVIVVQGDFKTGKTWLINLLFGTDLPSEKGLSTLGTSSVRITMDNVQTWIVDTEGGNEVRSNKKEQTPLEKLNNGMASGLPGEHILVLGDVTSSNEEKIQNVVLSSQSDVIYCIYNLKHKNVINDYVSAFSIIGGSASTIKTAKYKEDDVSVIFKKRAVSRFFTGKEMQIYSYVLLDNNSEFGKWVNEITIAEIRSQLSKTAKQVKFEPLLSSVNSLKTTIVENTNVDEVYVKSEDKKLEDKVIEMSSDSVNQRDGELKNLILRFFSAVWEKLKVPEGKVKEHKRVGRINIIGGSKIKEEQIIVSTISSLPHSFERNSTTVIIKVDCPSFVYGKTLFVSRLLQNRGGVKIVLVHNKEEEEEKSDMELQFSNIRLSYGKKLFMAGNSGEVGYTYCHNMTLYENGRLYLHWRVDGIPCIFFPKKPSLSEREPDLDHEQRGEDELEFP